MQRLELHQARRLFGALHEDDATLSDAGLMQIGEYLIDQEPAGTGASGTVYRGVKLGSERDVALKLLKRPVSDRRAEARAWSELDRLEQLACPEVPRLHEHGIYDDRLYLVYDYVDGMAIDQYCREEKLGLRDRVELLIRVANAVQGLHEQRTIHRDLKPDHIIVDAEGQPHLVDLGLAVVLELNSTSEVSSDDVCCGTVGFMSPEQARGERVSTRSDLFSLGAIACVLLTGQTPHRVGHDVDQAVRHAGEEPPRHPRELNPKLPRTLSAVLNKALQRNPEDRFASASELAADLKRWLDDRPVLSEDSSWWRDRWLSIKRQPAHWAWASAAVVMIAVLGGISAGAYATANREMAHRAAVDELAKKLSAILVAAFHDSDFKTAQASLTVFVAARESGYLSDERLFDVDAVAAELQRRGKDVEKKEVAALLAELRQSADPRAVLLRRLLRSLFPDEPRQTGRIAAWIRAVIPEDDQDEAVLSAIEALLNLLDAETP